MILTETDDDNAQAKHVVKKRAHKQTSIMAKGSMDVQGARVEPLATQRATAAGDVTNDGEVQDIRVCIE